MRVVSCGRNRRGRIMIRILGVSMALSLVERVGASLVDELRIVYSNANYMPCPSGSLAGVHGVSACCPVSCGHCGGSGCRARPGGRSACCALDVAHSGRSCSSSVGPPCIPNSSFLSGLLDHECVASVAVGLQSNCPSNRWQRAIQDTLQRKHMSYINIGANVGSNVNEFLNMYNRTWKISPKEWHDQTNAGCGACGACKTVFHKREPPPLVEATKSIHVVGVEMMSSTFWKLEEAFRVFQVPGTALHAAGGDVLQTVYEPHLPRPGHEYQGVATKGAPIPMITIDSITTMLPAPDTDVVDILSIDTEGHDALVLQGATTGISRHAFRVIEFEYHGVGAWAKTSLNATVSTLMKHNYRCYWQGNKGVLKRFRTSCNYEFKKWSNLVCAHEQNIVEIFEALSEDTRPGRRRPRL